MLRKIMVFGILLMIFGLSTAYHYQSEPPEEVITNNPSEFSLSEDEVIPRLEISSKSDLTVDQFGKILEQEKKKIKTWEYENGVISHYTEENVSEFFIIIARFEEIDGTKFAYNGIVSSFTQKIDEMSKLKIGRESLSIERKKGLKSIIFREANLLVYIEGNIADGHMVTYASIIESKIRETLMEDQ